jgi:hypothetical protein
VSQNTKFGIWHGLLNEAMPERIIDYTYSMALYQTAAVVWAQGETYVAQYPLGDVDLTKLYEQAIMLATLKGIKNQDE